MFGREINADVVREAVAEFLEGWLALAGGWFRGEERTQRISIN
jgi:hypothetical protein